MFYISNIETVPVSGRRRFNVFSPAYEAQTAKALYASTMEEFRGRILPANHPYTRTVKRVMDRLIRVSGKFCTPPPPLYVSGVSERANWWCGVGGGYRDGGFELGGLCD